MGGKKSAMSAKEKAAEKAKGQACADAKAREDADWEAAGMLLFPSPTCQISRTISCTRSILSNMRGYCDVP
jgi:hypothetical protein